MLHLTSDAGIIDDNVFGKQLPATSIACNIEEGNAKFVAFFLKRPPPDNEGISKFINDVLQKEYINIVENIDTKPEIKTKIKKVDHKHFFLLKTLRELRVP